MCIISDDMALFQVGLLSIVLSATLCQGRPQWQNKHTENGGILAPEDKMYRADNLEDFKGTFTVYMVPNLLAGF